MIEYISIFISGGIVGILILRTFSKNTYSPDHYVSKEMFVDEKKQVSELNKEKVRLSSEIAKHNGTIANYEIKLDEEKKNIEKQKKKPKTKKIFCDEGHGITKKIALK